MTDPASYDFPGDVSRSGDLCGSTADTRSGHLPFAALTPAQVSTGSTTFDDEWRAALADHERIAPAHSHPTPVVEPLWAVWETLRLTPPTWVTVRVTTREVALGTETLPPGAVVLVSPLLLGRSPDLVPGDPDGLADFDPTGGARARIGRAPGYPSVRVRTPARGATSGWPSSPGSPRGRWRTTSP